MDRDAQGLLDVWRLGNVLAADCPSRGILNHLTNRWGTLVMVALATGPHEADLRQPEAGGVRAAGGPGEGPEEGVIASVERNLFRSLRSSGRGCCSVSRDIPKKQR